MRIPCFAIIASLLASSAFAASTLYPVRDCNNLMAQLDLNQCAEANFESADKALNVLYRRLLAADTDAKSQSLLKESERAWIAFRDKECLREAASNEGGSIWPMVHSGCLERKTRERICELRENNDLDAPPTPCPK